MSTHPPAPAGGLAAASAGWTPRPLRVGLLVDSLTQPAWRRGIVEAIQGSGFARVVLVVRNAAPRPRLSRREKLRLHRGQLLHLLYRRVDDRLFRPPPESDAFAEGDLAPLLGDVPVLDVAPVQGRFTDRLDDADVERILAHDLDVAVRFGFRILKGRFLSVARFGVWSYHHADNRVNRGIPAGFWEVMEGAPVTGSVLQVLTEELDGGRVLYRSSAPTDPVSVRRSRNHLFWKSAAFLVRRLRELHLEGPAALERAERAEAWEPYAGRLYTNPTNAEMLRLVPRLAGRAAARALEGLAPPRPEVLVHRSTGASDGPAPVLHRLRPLPAPRGAAWDDPVPLAHGGRVWVLAVERRRGGAARLAAVPLEPKGGAGVPGYPQGLGAAVEDPAPFAWNGDVHLLARDPARRELACFRAVDFPARWEAVAPPLPGVDALRPALAEWQGRWWLFANVAAPGAGALDELHLFSAPTPLGPWAPHPRNPVVSDACGALPAGPPFVWEGRLHRPARDCGTGARGALVVHRVDRMDGEEYAETRVARVEPSWRPGLRAVRTLGAAGGVTVVGVLRR